MKSQHILKRNYSAVILMLFFIQLSPFLLKAKSFEKYHSFHQASILADAKWKNLKKLQEPKNDLSGIPCKIDGGINHP